MPPSTRKTARPTTPIKKLDNTEADTIRKTRFFEGHDHRKPSESITQIGLKYGVKSSTTSEWLKDRASRGTQAYRRRCPKAQGLGRKYKVSDETIRMLMDPKRNPVRHLPLDRQIAHHQLGICVRTLQRRLR